MKLIIVRPNPYVREARVTLQDKGIDFEEIVDNPRFILTDPVTH